MGYTPEPTPAPTTLPPTAQPTVTTPSPTAYSTPTPKPTYKISKWFFSDSDRASSIATEIRSEEQQLMVMPYFLAVFVCMGAFLIFLLIPRGSRRRMSPLRNRRKQRYDGVDETTPLVLSNRRGVPDHYDYDRNTRAPRAAQVQTAASSSYSDDGSEVSASLVESRVTSAYHRGGTASGLTQRHGPQYGQYRQQRQHRGDLGVIPDYDDDDMLEYQSSQHQHQQQQQLDVSLPHMSQNHQGRYRPSPIHPDPTVQHTAPAEVVISSTLRRLRSDTGIRLLAHGAKTKHPRRVWVRVLRSCVTWQTEIDTGTGGAGGGVGGVGRGAVHVINLSDVIYVDVGKQTAALRRYENASISDGLCFSLLTTSGSLDLQAPNALECDALVSCFCLILDEFHSNDWRRSARSVRGEGGYNGGGGGNADGGGNASDLYTSSSGTGTGTASGSGTGSSMYSQPLG